MGVALVGFAEGLGAAKNYAASDHYDIDANRELIGLGGGQPRRGAVRRHGRQRQPVEDRGQRRGGARTQVSGLVVAALTIVTLLFLTGLFEKLPEATLAAVVIAALIELVDYRSLRQLLPRLLGPARPDLRRRRADRLHRGDGGLARRAGLRYVAGPVHRDRDVHRPARVPLVPTARRHARAHPRHRRPVRRHRTPPGQRGGADDRHPPTRERTLLRERRPGQGGDPDRGPGRRQSRRSSSTSRPCRRST